MAVAVQNGSVNGQDRLTIHPSVVIRQEAEDKWLLFFPPTRGLHFIRPLGKELLDLCDGDRTVGQIAAELATRYELDQEDSAAQVTEFFSQLLSRRLLLVRGEV